MCCLSYILWDVLYIINNSSTCNKVTWVISGLSYQFVVWGCFSFLSFTLPLGWRNFCKQHWSRCQLPDVQMWQGWWYWVRGVPCDGKARDLTQGTRLLHWWCRLSCKSPNSLWYSNNIWYHWSLQHWFMRWLVTCSVSSVYMNQCKC